MNNENIEQSPLVTLPIWQLFMNYAVPSVITVLFFGVQNIIDGLIVSHYVGEYALGGVNIIMPLCSVIMVIALIVGIGSQALVSQGLGEKNLTKAGETLADYAGDWSFIKDNTGQLNPAGTGWASLINISANSVNMTNGDDPNDFPINKFDWAPDEQGGLYSLWEDYDQAHPTFKLQHVRLNFHGDTYDAIKLTSSGLTAWYEKGQ